MRGDRRGGAWWVFLAACLAAACSGSKPPPPMPLSGVAVIGRSLNPDRDHRSSPVVVRVYQLSSREAFASASFLDLQRKDEQVLGDELLHRELMRFCPDPVPGTGAIPPGRECRRSGDTFQMDLDPETRFLAAFGDFYDYRSSSSGWRSIVEVPAADDPMFGGPRMPPLRLTLDGASLSLAFE